MSGIFVGELILWLIVALIVIVVAVYVVNWLYHRSSKEVSFVRTGFLGEQVVINGGAFVLPFIHDFTPVNMNVLPKPISTSECSRRAKRSRSPRRRSVDERWNPNGYMRCSPASSFPRCAPWPRR